MKFLVWLVLAVIFWMYLGFYGSTIAQGAEPPRVLSLNFNDNVKVFISNQPCPAKALKDKYPLAAAAVRIDKARLKGCYTHEGDLIVIQWVGGDKSNFLANQFLMPNGGDL